MNFVNYIRSIGGGIKSLCTGLVTTMKVFFQKNTTDQYPENRATLHIAKRFRGELYMPLNEDGTTRCIACGLCESACPNGTITLKVRMEINPATGKPKKVLDEYIYDLGSCTFCQLCVNVCPTDAINFRNEFENAVFDRMKLVMRLDPVRLPQEASEKAGKTESGEKEAGQTTRPASDPATEPFAGETTTEK